ncbi:MAG: sigma-54 interaction domain-containing protein [Gemmataceae bacterium]
MSIVPWIRASDCALLQADVDAVDLTSLRLIQRLLELSLREPSNTDLIGALLEEIGIALQADQVLVLEGTPEWPVRWQYARRGIRSGKIKVPTSLLGEVLDRMAGTSQPADGSLPAFLAAPVQTDGLGQHALLATRSRLDFSEADKEYGIAASYYFAQALKKVHDAEQDAAKVERLETLLGIAEHLTDQRETVPLLEHIAEEVVNLVRCERASLFLWDRNRNELVGRPAIGMPNGELRIPDDAGIVGQVVKTGEVIQVDDVRADPSWNSQVDSESGFQTRSLLCVPLVNGEGECVGVLEAINKNEGRFGTQDVEAARALARQTVAALNHVQEHEALLRSNAEFQDQARTGCQIIGESTAVVEVRAHIERLAPTDLPVLILGESGTGKDVIARALHLSSPRHPQPYVPVNCAAIAESLIESELFGHEAGAFTGAQTTRAGKFEAADGGTLFLDELGELSQNGQAKLLRVLEEKNVYRVGSTQPIPVDTRIVAATNRDLAEQVRKGKFRKDLYYRLSVVTVNLPPLRDRQEDVLLLAEHFLQHFCRNAGRKSMKFSAEAKKRLMLHDWPGNIRELKNLIERIAYLCSADKIEAKDLAFISRAVEVEPQDDPQTLKLSEATDAFQIRHIKKAIERAGGNMSDAAKLLGLHRPNLYRKMRLLKMEVD